MSMEFEIIVKEITHKKFRQFKCDIFGKLVIQANI